MKSVSFFLHKGLFYKYKYSTNAAPELGVACALVHMPPDCKDDSDSCITTTHECELSLTVGSSDNVFFFKSKVQHWFLVTFSSSPYFSRNTPSIY